MALATPSAAQIRWEDLPEAPIDARPASNIGRTLPDIALRTADGRPLRLTDFRGRFVFLHVWGSWCPPCKWEFPELQKLHDSLKDDPRLAFVLVSLREPFAKSMAWAAENGFSLPLYDALTVAGDGHTSFVLAEGGRLPGRELSLRTFPTTILLDPRGVAIGWLPGMHPGWMGFRQPLLELMDKSQAAAR